MAQQRLPQGHRVATIRSVQWASPSVPASASSCSTTALRASVPVGVAAALVQVVGLLRWPLLVPGLAATPTGPGAVETFHRLNLVLGTVVGETLGYALTAGWTGVVEPRGVPLAGLVNFVGHILWSGWLVAVAVVILRRRR